MRRLSIIPREIIDEAPIYNNRSDSGNGAIYNPEEYYR